MKRYIILLVFSFFTLSSIAQTEKIFTDANAVPRKVDAFHAIMVEDGIDIYLTQGNEEAVAVSANKDDYRDKIVTKVVDGVLKIFYKNESGISITWRDRKLRAYVSVKNIDELRASGGSDIIVRGTITAGKLAMNLSGGSDFVGNIKSTELIIGMSGGSDLTISGTATNLKVNASGGSDFNGDNLQAEYAIVDVSGGSDARISVSKELFAEATGGSDIDYKGTPVIKYSSSSGGGSITRRN